MTNIADMAQDVEVRQWAKINLARPEPKNFAPTDPGYGPAVCAECGAEMHPVRRAYGYDLCVQCATEAEKITARRRR